MHEVAEYGVAAHWVYKQGETQETRRYPWMKALLEIIETASEPQDVLENTKLQLHSESVFVFTPKGELFELPRGATPIDFAYMVHSQVGDTCVGAKVNGKVMPLRQALSNGDQVEIITARGGEAAGEQGPGTVADEGAHLGHLQRPAAHAGQHEIGGPHEVRGGVHQGAVEVENHRTIGQDCLHKLAFGFGPDPVLRGRHPNDRRSQWISARPRRFATY